MTHKQKQKLREAKPTIKKIASEPLPSASEIDASLRAPVLFLFSNASAWLFLASIGFAISLYKLINPTFLSAYQCFTYGRLYPASITMLIYGFAIQTLIAIGLWINSRLCYTKLEKPAIATLAGVLWNIAVFVAVLGILLGDSSGFEYFDIPKYSAVILFCAFIVFFIRFSKTLQYRADCPLYPSRWFFTAFFVAFPIIFSAAVWLLHYQPLKGVAQTVVHCWFANCLFNLCLNSAILATAFYFIPKLLRRDLFGKTIIVLGFWLFMLFSCWGGFSTSLPLPLWVIQISRIIYSLLLIPCVIFAIILYKTSQPKTELHLADLTLFNIAALMPLLFIALNIFSAQPFVAQIIEFTLFNQSKTMLLILLGVVPAFLGTYEYMIPKIITPPLPPFKKLQLTATIVGAFLIVTSLLICGFIQGTNQLDYRIPISTAIHSIKPCLIFALIGTLIFTTGISIFLIRQLVLWHCIIRQTITKLRQWNTLAHDYPTTAPIARAAKGGSPDE